MMEKTIEIGQIGQRDLALWQRVFKRDKTHRAYRFFLGHLDQANGSSKYAAALLVEHLVAVAGPDAETVERMMRQTRLDQSEWDMVWGQQTWLHGRIQNAIKRRGGEYDFGQNHKTGGRARRAHPAFCSSDQEGGEGHQGGAPTERS